MILLTNDTSLQKLLTNEFINKYTNFTTQNEFTRKLSDKAGFNVETVEGIEKMDSDKLNEFVSQITEFNDWKSMLAKAVELYMAHRK